MNESFVIDVGICNGCYNCQIACKDEHCCKRSISEYHRIAA